MKTLSLGVSFLMAFSMVGSIAHRRPAKVVEVGFDYLEACETGVGECHPIVINRQNGETVKLVMPNAPLAAVSVWDEENFRKLSKRLGTYKPIIKLPENGMSADRRAPVLDLSALRDGTYHVWMTSCAIGGVVELHLRTQ
ncbi:hypothetical protein MUN81_21670 [Hymenobacter sp. 5317J-9]|uniref:hypothetical protein n=1 Tax=Hymenobacter sp. 5317J-9 TaxID=2932250 RepID=UPI001FD65D2A|nr:hypothetical protein [Hymenobacter sp. 5317J-9]UOQ97822.1 hypothetical protein MUN81_21670 [Hymenobacter sp. 5317J-9]